VFTARYGLIPCVKQITFRSLKVKEMRLLTDCIRKYFLIYICLRERRLRQCGMTAQHTDLHIYQLSLAFVNGLRRTTLRPKSGQPDFRIEILNRNGNDYESETLNY
jgi:hypothetical protein